MSRRQPSYPDCYGHLYDEVSEQCMSCLLRDQCSAVIAPSVHTQRVVWEGEIPKDKKALILAVCEKYGIPTKYFTKNGTLVDVEQNLGEFINLDFLITSKDALVKILTS